MRHGLKSPANKITALRKSQRGYMLITLMLALALITIGMLAVLPEIGQQIRRDREEEMRHRGTAYMRAIQHFYKKFSRYPMTIDELESSNNLRFLRKRYKDPMNRDPETGKEKDFKLLHQQDINLNSGPLLGQIPGQPGAPGASGANAGAAAGLNALAALGAQNAGMQMGGATVTQVPQNADAGDASDAEGKPNPSGSSNGTSPSSSSSSSPSSSPASGFNGPTFGGGPILGVASTSKAKSIRIFNDKDHYKDWLFVYIPMGDRGGLLNGPVSTTAPTANINGASPIGQGVAGPLGQQPAFGQPSGTPQTPTIQTPPPTPPDQ